jgi:O-methyltransferase involved in polyketide biosynthesis
MTKRHFTAAVLASTFLLPAAGAWAQDNDKYIQMDIQVTDWVDELLGEGFDEVVSPVMV